MYKCGTLLASLLVLGCIPKAPDGELTGVWESESNNIKFLMLDSGETAEFRNCGQKVSAPLTKVDNNLVLTGTDEIYLKIDDENSISFANENMEGVKLHKINSDKDFNSGSFTINSEKLGNLDITTGVCAYRESDNVYNVIAIPYKETIIEISLGLPLDEPGTYNFPFDASIRLQSDAWGEDTISGRYGSAVVTEYSDTKTNLTFSFTDYDGNEYTGSVNIDI